MYMAFQARRQKGDILRANEWGCSQHTSVEQIIIPVASPGIKSGGWI